jgi:UDP-glucose:(heptosyl)LPS alpha-1,3-glucosyltransferase
MKIAIALERLEPSRGGLESWARDLIQWLLHRGHDVHVAAFSFASERVVEGASLHQVPPATSRIHASEAMTHCVSNLGADIVHDLGVGWHFDVWHPQFGCRCISRARQQASRPLTDRWRSAWSPRQRRRWREAREIERRQISRPATRMIASSRMVAGHFEHLHGLPSDRIHVIYNGVDTVRFSPEACRPLRAATRAALGAMDRTPLVLLAATNFYLKGLPTALRALARVVAGGNDVRLLVAGRGDAMPFSSTIEHLGLGAHVTFLGHVDEMLRYYAAADAVVLPTYHDPCSLTVLEAWACGVPAITTRWNGASELMRDGREGYILDRSDDDERLAACLLQLLDRNRRTAMGRAARELALGCSQEDNFSRVADLYQAAAEMTARGARPSN